MGEGRYVWLLSKCDLSQINILKIKSQSGNKEDQKKRLEKVEDFYKHLSTQPCPTPSNEAIVNNDDVKKAIYFTEFHEIEKNEDLNISVKW